MLRYRLVTAPEKKTAHGKKKRSLDIRRTKRSVSAITHAPTLITVNLESMW